MVQQFIVIAFPEPLRESFFFVLALAPYWLPILLTVAFIKLWVLYRRTAFINSHEYILLELIAPQHVVKSPMAMENVLTGLHLGFGESTFLDRWFSGKTRPWFSLELVSLGGKIHFYIWTRKSLRRLVENNFYAQYPDIEIKEAQDYTRALRFDLRELGIWGCNFRLTGPDPVPIKTYVDYGLDRDPKEEFKIDPLAHVFEFLSSVKPHEQIWLQILIRTNKAEKKKPGSQFEYIDWKEEARIEIEKIRSSPEDVELTKSGDVIKKLSDAQKKKIEAINRSVAKQGFDAGIRGIYIVKKDGAFDPAMIAGMIALFKQFSSEALNGFKPTDFLSRFEFPWQDFREIRQNKDRYKVFDAYRRRSWFHPPYKTKHFVLSTEELATLFHLPSEGVTTPGIEKVPSTRQTAPANLPR